MSREYLLKRIEKYCLDYLYPHKKEDDQFIEYLEDEKEGFTNSPIDDVIKIIYNDLDDRKVIVSRLRKIYSGQAEIQVISWVPNLVVEYTSNNKLSDSSKIEIRKNFKDIIQQVNPEIDYALYIY
jgi:hypothetical protein